MEIIYQDDRRIIPRLRSFEVTAQTGELGVNIRTPTQVILDKDQFLRVQLSAWQREKNLVNAGDLLSSARVLGVESNFVDVAKYILEKDIVENSAIFKLADRICNLDKPVEVVKEVSVKDLNFNSNKYYPEIKFLKSILQNEPRNPVAWMEIGRLYSLVGQIDKANKCIDKALYLDPNNRFIVRSASRFFHHFQSDKEKPLWVIKNAINLKNDPWLMSAEIAYSSVLGRHSKVAKIGVTLLKDNSFNSSAITELASAVATLEYDSGKVKDARKLFSQALRQPNDNSLAQIIWMQDNVKGITIENSKYNLPFAYEANAKHYYQLKQFVESFEEAMRWHEDEPYSTRPIKLASYISSIFLKDHKKSVELINKALSLKPDDKGLLNNLVYYMILDGQLEPAKKKFETQLRQVVEDNDLSKESISCIATAGLLAYRENRPDQGKYYYEKAIHYAKRIKNEYYVSLATMNYVREAIKFPKTEQELRELEEAATIASKRDGNYDIQEIYLEVKSTISSLMNNSATK